MNAIPLCRRGVGLLLLAAVLLGLTGCAALESVLKLDRPTARLAGVSLKDINVDSATLLFDVEVGNPYSVPLPLVNIDYGLASRAEPFLAGKADIQGTVPARGKRTIALPAKITYVSLLKALKGVRLGSVIPYTAELGLSVDAPAVGVLRLPLKKEGELPVPAPPEVKVEQIQWDQISLDKAGGRVTLHLVNRNQFPLTMAKLSYGLSLAGSEVASSSLAQAVALGADDGAGTIEIPISFSPRKLGLAVFSMLTGKGSGYQLQGVMTADTRFGPISLPISKSGQTTFKK